jgi:cell division transport system permease protein
MILFKLTLRPWLRSPYNQFFSSMVVGFLLLVTGVLIWLQQGLKPVLSHLQHEEVVTAYLAPDVTVDREDKMIDEIRTEVGAHADIRLVPTDEFVANIKKQYPDLGQELDDLGDETAAIVPRYISITGVLPEGSIERIRTVAGIESAETSRDRYRQVVGAIGAIRWVARLLIFGLCMALFSGLIHLARTNMEIHRDAIALMRLMGASTAKLQLPSVFSGIWVGFCGGMVAAAGWVTAGTWLTIRVRSLSPLLREMPHASASLAAALFAAALAIGALAGLFGSLAAIQRDGSASYDGAGR